MLLIWTSLELSNTFWLKLTTTCFSLKILNLYDKKLIIKFIYGNKIR